MAIGDLRLRIFLTCPCMFIITTVLLLLLTINCSGFLGRRVMVWIVKSPPDEPPSDLYVETHSPDFILQTLTLPSQEALNTWWPSAVKMASLTNEVWPRNSFRVLPDFKPWTLQIKVRIGKGRRIIFAESLEQLPLPDGHVEWSCQ